MRTLLKEKTHTDKTRCKIYVVYISICWSSFVEFRSTVLHNQYSYGFATRATDRPTDRAWVKQPTYRKRWSHRGYGPSSYRNVQGTRSSTYARNSELLLGHRAAR